MQIETGKILNPKDFEKIRKQLEGDQDELEKYMAIDKGDMTAKERRLKQVDLSGNTKLAKTARAHRNYLKRRRKKGKK